MVEFNLLNQQWEFAYVGCIKEKKINILEGPFTNSSKDFVIIPPEILMKLIVFCIENELSPVIIHNHTNNCSFSIPDFNFMLSFREVYLKKGGNQSIIMGLINSKNGECKVIYQKGRI